MSAMSDERLAKLREYVEAGLPLVGRQALDLLAEVDRLRAALARVKALHQPEEVTALTGDCAAEECEHDNLDDCEKATIQVCAEGYRAALELNDYYGEQGLSEVTYPCPTIRAIEGESND